jgi:hypothetical protein
MNGFFPTTCASVVNTPSQETRNNPKDIWGDQRYGGNGVMECWSDGAQGENGTRTFCNLLRARYRKIPNSARRKKGESSFYWRGLGLLTRLPMSDPFLSPKKQITSCPATNDRMPAPRDAKGLLFRYSAYSYTGV